MKPTIKRPKNGYSKIEDIDLATTKFLYSSQKEQEYYKLYYERKDMEE